jgi:uncharacterized protein
LGALSLGGCPKRSAADCTSEAVRCSKGTVHAAALGTVPLKPTYCAAYKFPLFANPHSRYHLFIITGANRVQMAALTSINPLYSLAGLFVGILVGLTGVGGGSLMTPLLVLLFGIEVPKAVGTDLLYAAMTKSVGTMVHGFRSTVDWRIVRRLASGSVPAAIITLFILKTLGTPTPVATKMITTILGGMLLITSVAVMYQARVVAFAINKLGAQFSQDRPIPTIMLGAMLGILVSISSVGAGAIGVTALLILYPHLPVSRIVGSDIAHAVPLTLVAGIGHWYLGNVDFHLLFSLLAGSIPGIIIGSYVGSGASDRILRPILAVVLVIVGVKLFL